MLLELGNGVEELCLGRHTVAPSHAAGTVGSRHCWVGTAMEYESPFWNSLRKTLGKEDNEEKEAQILCCCLQGRVRKREQVLSGVRTYISR